MRTSVILFALASVVLGCAPAFACSIQPPPSVDVEPHPPRAGESVPPAPAIRVEQVQRGNGREPQTSCSDIGWISLSVPDDAEAAAGIYLFELVSSSGEQPEVPAGPIRASAAEKGRRWFALSWIDGADDEQEPLHVRIRVTALSPTGARGGSIIVEVDDPGR